MLASYVKNGENWMNTLRRIFAVGLLPTLLLGTIILTAQSQAQTHHDDPEPTHTPEPTPTHTPEPTPTHTPEPTPTHTPGGDVCEDGRKLETLTMIYTGDDCSATFNSQDSGSVICSDSNGGPNNAAEVNIRASTKEDPDQRNSDSLFNGVVALNGSFTLDAVGVTRQNRLGGDTYIQIEALDGTVLQNVKFHTSCSQPLNAGDQFGASLVSAGTLQP